MSGRSLDDFLSDQAAFDALTDDDKARLFAGEVLEGDTPAQAEENGETPAAVVENDSKEEVEPKAVEAVVLAKDGVHTIPYAELEAARERARQLEAELQQARAAKPEPEKVLEPEVKLPNIAELVRERDEALFAGDTEKAAEVSMKIIEIQEERAYARFKAESLAEKAAQSQETELQRVHARADELIRQYEFLNPQSQNVNQTAIDLVIAQRDRLMAQGVPVGKAIEDAVATVAPLFSKPTTTQQPTDAAAKAAEAAAKAKSQVPTSLSQIPAGGTVHHDEGEAIRDMTGLSLINKFMGKTPDQINELLAKAI